MNMQRDVVVIGAGPAGLACASLLAQRGVHVLLADEQREPGGQIYRGIGHVEAWQPELLEVLGTDYARGASLVEAFHNSGAEYRPRTSVWQVTPEREVWASCDGRSEMWQAGVVVVATGAMERPVPVPGWTLPGVMTAGAVQILLKSGLRADEPLVLVGSGPLFYLLARQCLAARARLAAIVDTGTAANQRAALWQLPRALSGEGPRTLYKGLEMVGAVRRSGVPLFRQATDIRIEGVHEAAAVSFRSGGQEHRVPAPIVALHEGVIPAQQMTRSIGCAHVWDVAQRCFRPVLDDWGNSSVERVLVAGDGGGIGGALAAEHAGRLAAMEALWWLGRLSAAERDAQAAVDARRRTAHLAVRPILDALYPPRNEILNPPDDVVVCRCEEVTAGAVRAVVRQGCQGPNQAKAFLRVGMGLCQGRICGPVVSEIIARARGISVADTGYYRIRPPLKPIGLGELAAAEA
jgi:NADPH-dependent 2,4-dienoyl-CoA reductase/sulfur reductase-like enzyme